MCFSGRRLAEQSRKLPPNLMALARKPHLVGVANSQLADVKAERALNELERFDSGGGPSIAMLDVVDAELRVEFK